MSNQNETLSIILRAVGATQASRDIQKVDSTIGRLATHATTGLKTAASNIAKLGMVAGGAAVAGITAAVKVAGDFEAQLNTINTVAMVSQDQLAGIGDQIRAVARDTGTSLTDLTGAYYDLVSAGVSAADATTVLRLANTLAIGGLASTGETVDLLTTAINTYGLNAKQASVATDEFAEAIALGKVTAAQLAASFSIVGPLAQAAGIGIDQISASYAVLTAKGIPAEQAATDMRSAIQGLIKPTAALTKAQKDLNVNFAAVAKAKGLPAALQLIRDYSEKTGVPLAKLLGRIEGVQYLLSTTGANADDYATALAKVRDSTGEAAAQMAERQQGLNFQLSRLKALAIDAGITIGSALLPKLTPLVEKLNEFISTHQGDIAAFGDQLADAFTKIAAYAERIPWSAIGDGLKTAGFWAGKLFDLFAALPPSTQATIVALAGLNKLSGGAIGSIVGELGKGLIKGVLGMNAGVVNINAAVVKGGGGPSFGPPGPGGPTSGDGFADTLGRMFKTAFETIPFVAIAVAAENEILTNWTRQNRINAGLDPDSFPKTLDNTRSDARTRYFANRTATPTAPLPARVNLAAVDEAMFRSIDNHILSTNAATAARTESLREHLAAKLADANRILQGIEAKREENRISLVTRVSTYVTNRVTVGGINKTQTTYRQYQSGGAQKFAL